MINNLLKSSEGFKEDLIKIRRNLHENPEVGFDLPNTVALVKKELENLGYKPKDCGRAGVVATVGKGESDKVFLIRGDMDALPIEEETDLDFKSKNKNMHACGHDFHTTMMLGAARLLKEREEEIEGTVKLMFQPAEETLLGAKDMIKNGLLEDPKVDAAMMIHVMTGLPLETGTVAVPPYGIGSSASDWFTIDVKGKGGHGASPQESVDPINIATHIYLALQSINSREIAPNEDIALTIGAFNSGRTGNVIPEEAELIGTLRTFNKETRKFVMKRMEEIVENTAKGLRGEAEVNFGDSCPSIINDEELVDLAINGLPELIGEDRVLDGSKITSGVAMSGSEDFGFLSEEVPTLMLGLAAGDLREGYKYGAHHPKVVFDEEALTVGSSVYAYMAMKWLEENK